MGVLTTITGPLFVVCSSFQSSTSRHGGTDPRPWQSFD